MQTPSTAMILQSMKYSPHFFPFFLIGIAGDAGITQSTFHTTDNAHVEKSSVNGDLQNALGRAWSGTVV